MDDVPPSVPSAPSAPSASQAFGVETTITGPSSLSVMGTGTGTGTGVQPQQLQQRKGSSSAKALLQDLGGLFGREKKVRSASAAPLPGDVWGLEMQPLGQGEGWDEGEDTGAGIRADGVE